MRPSAWITALACSLVAGCGEDATRPLDAGSIADVTAIDAPSDALTGVDTPPRVDAPGETAHGSVDLELPGRAVRLTLFDDGAVRVQTLSDGAPAVDRGWTHVALDLPANRLMPTVDGPTLRFANDNVTVTVARATGVITVLTPAGEVVHEELPTSATDRALARRIAPGERITALGEKTGRLDRTGRRVEMWNTDVWAIGGGMFPPDIDPLYVSIPFAMSLVGARASGLYVENTSRTVWNLGRTTPNELRVTADAGRMDYWVFPGPTPARVIEQYTRVTGRPPLPPRWALGYHQSRWSYAPASALTAVADEMRARSIPCDGLWLDIDHMEGYRSFTWSREGFPSPAETLARLRGQGFHVVNIIDPGLKRDPDWSIYRDARDGGHLVRRADGSEFSGRVWPGEAVFPDFTRDATRAWWRGLMASDARAGLDGAWIDMNEPTVFAPDVYPVDARVDGNGAPTEMREAHNVYALLMARATWEGQRDARPERRPFVLTRAGFAGTQRYAAVWTGDTMSTWAHLAMLPAMLTGMGLSGLPFTGSDAGGYSGGGSPELFTRWMQAAALTPFFRNHVQTGSPRQEPWSFGPAVESAVRAAIELRYSLLPYLYSLAYASTQTGAPVVRPLAYEFGADALAHDDVFLLGPSLLVAPVLRDGDRTRMLPLPVGRWTNLFDDRTITGPRVIEVDAPLDALPVWARPNGIVPRAGVVQHTGQASGPLTLDLYPDPDSPASRVTLYDDAGDGPTTAGHASAATLTADAGGATLDLGAPWPEAISVRVHHVTTAPRRVSLADAAAPSEAWRYDLAARTVTLTLPAGALRARVEWSAATAPTPRVTQRFEVTLPASTPEGAAIYLATSVTGWDPAGLLMTRDAAGRAVAEVSIEAGTRVGFKVTRGSWSTVERAAGCAEVPNREVSAGSDAARVTVAAWADRCE
ncbi:MAG: glycoside hydrolase family 31 protein [Polyangiales bacterium]